MSLKDDLTDIRGVGDATAGEIMAVLEAQEQETVPTQPVERALDKLQDGRVGLCEAALETALDE